MRHDGDDVPYGVYYTNHVTFRLILDKGLAWKASMENVMN